MHCSQIRFHTAIVVFLFLLGCSPSGNQYKDRYEGLSCQSLVHERLQEHSKEVTYTKILLQVQQEIESENPNMEVLSSVESTMEGLSQARTSLAVLDEILISKCQTDPSVLTSDHIDTLENKTDL